MIERPDVCLTEGVGNVGRYHVVKARKNLFRMFGYKFTGKDADQWYQNKTAHHSKYARVEGIFKDKAKESVAYGKHLHADHQLHDFKTGAEDEAGCNGGFGNVFAVKSVKKGCKEGTGKCPPGNAHHLCNKYRVCPYGIFQNSDDGR